MSDLKCAQALVLAAERDLELVQLMLEHSAGADEVFGFHVQQAVEKLLKAWLAIRGESYPLTHDLEQLFEVLAQGGVELGAYRTTLRSPSSIGTRRSALKSSPWTVRRLPPERRLCWPASGNS